MSLLGVLVIVVLLLFLFGAMPGWNHSRNWGWAPGSLLGLLLVVVVVVVLLGML